MGSANAVDPSSKQAGPATAPAPPFETDGARPGDRVVDARSVRRHWLDAFAWHLCSLRPETPWADAESLATALWPELSAFDPRIAAELEHESSDDAPHDRGSG